MELIKIFIKAMIINNIVLTGFLGICSYLGVSKKTDSAVGMGVALTLVNLFTAVIAWGLDKLLVYLQIEFMRTICFILVIATLVQLVELIIKKFFPSLYKSLGIYLPLITTNCIILFTAQQTASYGVNQLLELIFYALGTSLGYLLIITVFSVVRTKLDAAPVSKGFKGVAIALVCTAFMAMAFSGFAGLI